MLVRVSSWQIILADADGERFPASADAVAAPDGFLEGLPAAGAVPVPGPAAHPASSIADTPAAPSQPIRALWARILLFMIEPSQTLPGRRIPKDPPTHYSLTHGPRTGLTARLPAGGRCNTGKADGTGTPAPVPGGTFLTEPGKLDQSRV
ncbi:hypothetical protein GCM10027405_29570 [Arthrobacter alkaliphilus]